jgi:PAS domain S-box-containing protein
VIVSSPNPQEILSLIHRNPLIVRADLNAIAAIVMMDETNSSYVLVGKENDVQNLGIFTERDLIRISSQHLPLDRLSIQDVMNPCITIQAAEITDLTSALTLFEKYQTRYLVVLQGDRSIGLLAKDSLTEILVRNCLQLSDRPISELEQKPHDRKPKELEQVASELIKNETKFRFLVEEGSDLIWAGNTDGRFTYLSPQFKTLFGWEPSEWIGKVFLDLVHPEDIASVFAREFKENFRSGKLCSHPEFRHLHRDGYYIWVRVNSVPILNSEGIVIGSQGTLSDISDRKLAELENQQIKERMQFVLSANPAVIFTCKLDGDYGATFITENVQNIFGYTPAEFTSESSFWFDRVHPDDLPLVLSELPTLIEREHLIHEYRFLHQDGYYLSLRAELNLLRDLEGIPIEMVGYLVDISDRKAVEIALGQSQAQFRRLAENVPGMIYRYVLHPDGSNELTYVSHGIRAIFELEPADVIQNIDILRSRIHPEDIPHIQTEINLSAQNLEPFYLEYRIILPSGLKWVQSISRPELQENGDILWDGVMLDISDCKRSEVALLNSERRYQALFNHKSDIVLIHGFTETKEKSRFIEVNDTACNILGYSRAELLTMTPSDLMPKDFLCKREGIETLRSQKYASQEVLLQTKDGRILPVELSMSELETVEGTPLVIAFARDISDRKQVEAQIQQQNQELLRATRLKDEFLANMSHELRTPLNAILGMSEALLEEVYGTLNERQKGSIATIENSGQLLLALINDILELSKIGAGKLELNIAKASISELCKSSLVFVKQQAFKKEIQLNLILPKNLGEMAVDERRIRQVLINLLTNAVKFTPIGGRVNLEVYYEPMEVNLAERIPINSAKISSNLKAKLQDCPPEQGHYVCISVTDTGIGIAPADQLKLFQPFFQVESALNRQYEGTGLGLALVKQIVELHEGDVSLRSELGQGSCFTVRLPYVCDIEECSTPDYSLIPDRVQTSAAIASSSSPLTEPQNKPLILLAEDNEANITTVSSYLEAKGYRIILAKNGEEAIAFAKTHHPDLILMDIQMPIMDGLEATKHIRLDPKLINIPIIALTALAMTGDRDRCLEAGANAYLSKPVKLKELTATIFKML